MREQYRMVQEWHRKFGQPVAESPRKLDEDRARKRARWMHEEVEEFIAAANKSDQARELVDVIYFALGTFVEMGIDPTPIFAAVHRANMAKLGAGGEVKVHEDGKVKKPSSWRDPGEEIRKLLS